MVEETMVTLFFLFIRVSAFNGAPVLEFRSRDEQRCKREKDGCSRLKKTLSLGTMGALLMCLILI
jgi:hypothetical protein